MSYLYHITLSLSLQNMLNVHEKNFLLYINKAILKLANLLMTMQFPVSDYIDVITSCL